MERSAENHPTRAGDAAPAVSPVRKSPSKRESSDEFVRRRLRARRRIGLLRVALLTGIAALLAWRSFRGATDDFSRFDRRGFGVAETIDGDSFRIDDRDRTVVTLLGADAPDLPDGHFAHQSAGYLRGRLTGARVLLRLDGTQTRDSLGRLRAYVYLNDSNLVNADIVKDGRAYADRRMKHSFGAVIEQLEAEARKKQRGLWDGLRDEQQPAWRKAWLEERSRDDGR